VTAASVAVDLASLQVRPIEQRIGLAGSTFRENRLPGLGPHAGETSASAQYH